jgi:hypothetical protein
MLVLLFIAVLSVHSLSLPSGRVYALFEDVYSNPMSISEVFLSGGPSKEVVNLVGDLRFQSCGVSVSTFDVKRDIWWFITCPMDRD